MSQTGERAGEGSELRPALSWGDALLRINELADQLSHLKADYEKLLGAASDVAWWVEELARGEDAEEDDIENAERFFEALKLGGGK